jgi:hypothetical protein
LTLVSIRFDDAVDSEFGQNLTRDARALRSSDAIPDRLLSKVAG